MGSVMKKAVLLVHGGAGALKTDLGSKSTESFTQGLHEALMAGYEVLQRGKSSLDAVEAAVQSLENNPCFNAGHGSVISHSGICELDASIMDGKSGKAGAVAGITVAKNPISAARAVMEQTEYVLLAGSGANSFAHDMKLYS
jgi:L-asparaginase / beta-aspartyl-peptidase